MNLLEEAKIRYPIGSIFSNKNLGYNCTNIKIRNSLFHEGGHNTIWLSNGGAERETGIFTLYEGGQWAEVTDYAIPEKWCVKVNSSHLDYPELYQWRLESPVSCNWGNHEGYIHSTGIHYLDIKTGYTEIRIEDFIKYIYKGNTETTKTKEPSKYCEYWKYIEDSLEGFTKDKIYKTLYPENVNKCSSFIDNYGKEDGWLGKNTEKFIPSTYEEYCKQEGINVIPKYVKCIRNGANASMHEKYVGNSVFEGKYYEVIEKSKTIKGVILDVYVCKDVKETIYTIYTKYTEEATEEDYLAQNTKKEDSLIGRYAKLILKGDSNEGKYYLITSKDEAIRLFDNTTNCSFTNNLNNWEIMPIDFVYTGQDVKKEEPMEAYTGKIPKLHMADEARQGFTHSFRNLHWDSVIRDYPISRPLSRPFIWGIDPYEPKRKQIKIIELPKVKKRFVY